MRLWVAMRIVPLDPIREFLRLESAGGIVLVIAAGLAVIASNSPLGVWYDALLDTLYCGPVMRHPAAPLQAANFSSAI